MGDEQRSLALRSKTTERVETHVVHYHCMNFG